jgi:15-cis-phytoene synthase
MTLSADDLDACRTLLRAGSKSFSIASHVLPKRVREPATVFYAFCRELDDVVDEASTSSPMPIVTKRVDDVFAGRATRSQVDRAMTQVARDFELPRTIFGALIEGFAWDLGTKRYRTKRDVIDYAVRVAGSVGVCMSLFMGCRERNVLARAADLGIAMQLTNIARDVGEDARRGRVYLPEEWLEVEGIRFNEVLRANQFDPRVGRVVARLLHEADWYYENADRGIAALPADCRPAIRTASRVYRAIGGRIRSAHFDSVTRRAYVPLAQKLALVLSSAVSASGEKGGLVDHVDPSVTFLIDDLGDAVRTSGTQARGRKSDAALHLVREE